MKRVAAIGGIVAAWAALQEAPPGGPPAAPAQPPALDAVAIAERDALLARLKSHPYFQRVELVPCAEFPPTLWLVQRHANAPAGFERDVGTKCEPWLAATRAALATDFAAAFPKARRAGRSLDVLAVLASEGDFGNYWKLCGSRESSGGNHWNAELDLGVFDRDVFEKPDENADRFDALWLLARSHLDACTPEGNAPAHHLWAREGLAFALAMHGGDAAAPKVGVARPGTLRWWTARLRDESERPLAFAPIEELLAIGDWKGVRARASRASGVEVEENGEEESIAIHSFMAESGLFATWLWREEEGRYRPLLVERLAAHLGTRPAPPATAFDLAALQAKFMEWFGRESAKAVKSKEEALPPELLRSLAEQKSARGGPAAVAASGAGRPGFTSKLLDPAFDPADLLDEPLPPEGRLGALLQQAAGGDLEGAATAIDALAAELPADDPLAARARRDEARVKELSATRRAFFTAITGDKKKLRFERAGTTVTGNPQGLDGDVLQLAGAKGVVERVPLASITCEELLRAMGDLKRDEGSAATRAFAALLAGRKTWAKTAAGATPEESALRADGDESARLLASGAAARIVEELARAPRPTTVSHGEAAMERIAKLLADHRKEALVAARLPALRALAAWSIAPLFEARGYPGLPLAGKVENLGEGRVRVTWDFESAAQANDFTPDATRKELKGSHQLKFPMAESYLRVELGALRGRGFALWRSKLAFAAPLRCRYRYSYVEPPASFEAGFCNLCVLLCDAGPKKTIATIDMAGIEVQDAGKYEIANESVHTDYATPYEVTVVHDGKRATLTCPGFPERSVAVFKRQSGAIGVMCDSDVEAALDLLEIEAQLDPTDVAKWRETWLEKELEARFEGKPAKPRK